MCNGTCVGKLQLQWKHVFVCVHVCASNCMWVENPKIVFMLLVACVCVCAYSHIPAGVWHSNEHTVRSQGQHEVPFGQRSQSWIRCDTCTQHQPNAKANKPKSGAALQLNFSQCGSNYWGVEVVTFPFFLKKKGFHWTLKQKATFHWRLSLQKGYQLIVVELWNLCFCH